MNWRRGLFRLWIVGAALFVIAVVAVNYSDITAEFDAAAKKVISQQATGKQIFEFQTSHGRIEIEASDINAAKKEWANKPEPVGLSKLSDAELVLRYLSKLSDAELVALYNKSLPNPWAKLGRVAAIAFGIPMAVLILGASLVWAFSGFAATRA
jgi:hypothetical protein